MTTPSYEENKEKAEFIDQLIQAVDMQITGSMDWVRTRAFWETKLPLANPEYLAEALTYALSNALRRNTQHK